MTDPPNLSLTALVERSWIDTHVSAPFTRPGNELNVVNPRRGDPIRFYTDVPEILHMIQREEHNSYIAACSRTSAPD